jgi:hypothetical protein
MTHGARLARLGIAAATAVLLLAVLPPSGLDAPVVAATAASEEPTRIVAIGDIHGHLDGFVAILQEAGLIDSQQRWIGGRAVLVQTGDSTDRGTRVRDVLDLLMSLEEQAARAGGRVITLLGNHELMNLLGELRDVTPEICETFVDARSERRQEQAWQQYMRLVSRRSRDGGTLAPVYQRTKDDWMAAWAPGCLEYYEAMGPGGKYGKWLRRRPVAAVVGDTLFMHAGPPPDIDATTVDDINTRIADEVERFDRFSERLVRSELGLSFFTLQEIVEVAHDQITSANARVEEARAQGKRLSARDFDLGLLREAEELLRVHRWWALAGQGPLWFRGYAMWADEELEAPATALLERLGVRRLVVGHSVMQDARIRVRLDGRLFLIDTGMLAAQYRGRPSALELRGAHATAVYLEGRDQLVPIAVTPD